MLRPSQTRRYTPSLKRLRTLFYLTDIGKETTRNPTYEYIAVERPFKDLEKLDEKVHTGKVRATVRRLSPTRANHACNERARARTSCGLYGCRGAGPDGDNDVNSAKEITRRNLGRPFGRLQYRNGETV